jgi:hypothetical protein
LVIDWMTIGAPPPITTPPTATGREGLRAYLEKERPHLLRSYDADFLVDAVTASRARAQAR